MMRGHIGLTVVFLLCLSAVSVCAHDPLKLDARRAAPGDIQLALIELPRTTVPATVRYRLQAIGVPRGVIFGIFAKDFAHTFHEVASGLQVDESGNIVASELSGDGRLQRLDEIVLEPGPYPLGAPWEVALVSADHTMRAFAKVIPYPLMARHGPCSVSLELVSHRGERFIASGAGFPPAQDVITELRYAGRVIQKQRRISPEGLLPPDVLTHGSSSTDRSAHYTVKGHSCDVAVEYEWGEPALSRH